MRYFKIILNSNVLKGKNLEFWNILVQGMTFLISLHGVSLRGRQFCVFELTS